MATFMVKLPARPAISVLRIGFFTILFRTVGMEMQRAQPSNARQ
jgi:hypothetical protein